MLTRKKSMSASLLAISARKLSKTKVRQASAMLHDVPPESHSETDADEGEGDREREDEEYTLSAFGNISLSNLYFVPSADSEISPSTRGSLRLEPGKPAFPRKKPRTSSYTYQSNYVSASRTTPVFQPSDTGEHTSRMNFRAFVESLKLLHPRERSTELPAVQRVNQSLKHGDSDVCSAVPPPPLQSVPNKNRDKVEFRSTPTSTPTTPQGMVVTAATTSGTGPVSAELFRPSGKLPRRPPLPRWDSCEEPAPITVVDSLAVES